MSDWKECKLGDVIEIEMGQSPKGETCNTKKMGLPLLNGPTEFGIRHPIPLQYTIDPKRKATFGDLLFCVRGSTTGRMNWSDQEYAIGRGIAAIRHKKDKNLNRYIKSLIDHNLPILLSSASGSVFPNITGDQLKNIQILLPSLSEQYAIAGVLSSLDDKIDLLHRQNKTLEGMAEALWRKMFVEDADPQWKKGKLGDIVVVKHGFAFKGTYIIDQETDKILVTPGNFEIGGGFKDTKFKYYSARDFPDDYILMKDDLIITMTDLSKEGDTLGYPAFVPAIKEKLLLHNQRIGKIVFKIDADIIYKYFLYFLLKRDEYRAYVLGSSSGTSIMHTAPDRICAYEFNAPPQNKVILFYNYALHIFQKINFNHTQTRTLTSLRDTLLPKLMSGDVRVRI